jgi:hypothetical protein
VEHPPWLRGVYLNLHSGALLRIGTAPHGGLMRGAARPPEGGFCWGANSPVGKASVSPIAPDRELPKQKGLRLQFLGICLAIAHHIHERSGL